MDGPVILLLENLHFMTVKESVLKVFYPVLMKAGKMFGLKAAIKKNKNNIAPLESFYDLKALAIDGTKINFNDFRKKNVLIVNTASGCGYTNQLSDLEKLYELYKDKLIVIGFPSNDFKEQEKLSDDQILSFCSLKFGVAFLLAKKSEVVKTKKQNEVFRWLTDSKKNGWNDKDPEWNFSKYLINENGVLTNYFGPGVEPLSKEIRGSL